MQINGVSALILVLAGGPLAHAQSPTVTVDMERGTDSASKVFIEQHAGETIAGALIKTSDTTTFVPIADPHIFLKVQESESEVPQEVVDQQQVVTTFVNGTIQPASRNGQITIENKTSIAGSEWLAGRQNRLERLNVGTRREELATNISKAVRGFDSAYQEYSELPLNEQILQARKIVEKSEETKQSVSEALLAYALEDEATFDDRTVTEMLRLLHEVSKSEETLLAINKAQYENTSNYSPSFYKYVASCSDAVAKVRGPGSDRDGTGFLVGKNLLLTCHHVVDGFESGQLRVFFYEDNGAGGATYQYGANIINISREYAPSNSLLAPSPSMLDIALIELVPTSASKTGGIDYLIAKNVTPISLGTRILPSKKNLFSIGFPSVPPVNDLGIIEQGGMAIHEGMRVFLPYEVKAADFYKILQDVASARINSTVAGYRGGIGSLSLDAILPKDQWASYNANIKKDIILACDLYQYKGAPLQEKYYYWRKNNNGEYGPGFGFPARTYRGDSGGPVLSKDLRTRTAVGLFVGGADDDPITTHPAPRPDVHEFALPISAVVDHLETLAENGNDLIQKYEISITN